MKTKKYKHTSGKTAIQVINNLYLIEGTSLKILPELVENTTDWEEVTELNFEVLEFKSAGEVYKKRDCNTFGRDGYPAYWSQGSFYSDSIHKIKRLSDGQEFTIGDKTKLPNWNNWCTIIEFKIVDNVIQFHLEEKSTITEGGVATSWYNLPNHPQLEDFVVYKEPVYITEDGFEVTEFNKDKLHWVYQEEVTNKYYIGNHMRLCSLHLPFTDEERFLFYSEEKAKEFIEKKNEENKIMFVTNDGVSLTYEEPYYEVHSDLSISKFVARTSCKSSQRIRFSTRKLAEAYVEKKNEEKLLDSKVLSYNQMISDLATVLDIHLTLYEKKVLKDLLKSRQ